MVSWTLVIILFSIIFPLLLVAAIHNLLVRRKTMVQEAWSGIDAQLRRRANLIPNLVETVKGYLAHERDTLEVLTRGRTASMEAASVGEQGRAEGRLGAALGRLIAVAEAYPDLKASENFIALQVSLGEVEDEIQLARRYYNGTVRDLNILIESFPSNLVAKAFRFIQAEFFELENPEEAKAPKIGLRG